jgi:molecular chaperone Hsp33
MLIQNLASLGGIQPVRRDGDHSDDWPRALALFSTIEAHELVDPQVEAERLLYRLFHEDGVRVFDVVPLSFGCRCSAERVMAVLKQYPAAELQGLAEGDGLIRATCEFCSTVYAFAPDSVG